MNRNILTAILCIIAMLTSCGGGSKTKTKGLDDCPVVGKVVQVGDDQVLVCEQSLLTEQIRMPLSYLTEELQIVKLDNKEEALVGQTAIVISDTYFLIWNKQQIPFKLFDREGKFITTIGAYGQGPGEYLNVYDAMIDEENDRIYLLPWQSANLLVYDLKGNSLPPIPLCLRAPKGKFTVNAADSTVAVVLLPFQGIPAVAWTQDFHGNRKEFIAPGHLEAPQDFSNEVIACRNGSVFDVNILCIMPTRVDSLYHYDYKSNRMRPVFALNFSEDPIPWHGYVELPNHFIGDASYPVQVSANSFESSPPTNYIIDKKTGKGAFMFPVNDFLGDAEIEWPTYAFNNGYYSANLDPGNLSDILEKALKKGGLSDETKTYLSDLKNSIQPNDNNYVLYAKLKR